MGSQVAQADAEFHYAAEDGLELMTRGLRHHIGLKTALRCFYESGYNIKFAVLPPPFGERESVS